MKTSKLKTNGFAVTRLNLGFSQQQLADQLGVSRSTIAMAETGRRSLPTLALIRLAQMQIKNAEAQTPDQISEPGETKRDLDS